MTNTTTQDAFTLSFQTKPNGGEDGLDFLRPDPYTVEQLQAEIVDLVSHPDNAHVVSLEIRRVGRIDGAMPQVIPPNLHGNAYAGFALEFTNIASDLPSCLITDSPQVVAEKLAGLLMDSGVASIRLHW